MTTGLLTGLMLAVALPVNTAQAATLDQRVKRLERMMENPVLLQLSRRLGEQQREIQTLQDENDRLKRQLEQFKKTQNQRYAETDERLSRIEGTEPKSIPETSGQAKALEQTPTAVSPSISKPAVVTQPGKEKLPSVKPPLEKPLLGNELADKMQPKLSQPTAASIGNSETEKTRTEKVELQAVKAGELETQQSEAVNQKPIKTAAATDVEKLQYKQAFALMRESKYTESIVAFEKFYNSYPKSELSSNAAYWAGEGYIILNKPQKALGSFMKVLIAYPGSPKIPDATLRAGDSHDLLGNKEKAQTLYQQVIDLRPHSRAAKNARKRLAK